MPNPNRPEVLPSLRRACIAVLLAGSALLLLACGGGEDRSKAQIRLINASVDHGALDLYDEQGRRLKAAVAFGGDAGYAEVDPDDADLDVTRAGSTTPLASPAPVLAEGDRYSLVAYSNGSSLATVVIDDNVGAPDSGKTRIRVLNAAPDAGALDVYLTAADVDLADAEPAQANAGAGTVSALVTADAATWRLRVTAAGDRDDLRLDLPALTLASRDVVTLVLTPGAGGVLVDALVLVQRAEVTLRAGTAARVRVVAGVTASGAVAASAGGVTLMNGTGAPAAGAYRLVPAGEAGASASVDGRAIDVPAAALTAGRDYTLLVYGPADAAVAAWMADDNRLPTVSGRAKLRLVHGLADVTDAIALTLDFNPVADGVAAGTASPSAQVDAVTTGALSVTAPGRGSPLWQADDQVLAAGSVYTLFVVGAESTATGILRKDR
ncbi:DUF4397 domain-containing protein [Rubrivivax albus]|uniref:DUF4397 domain-containing protein n=1 Tax=Rubrivivax albus TaxID=2499835 RepID=A0A3S2TS06_9BURK|nr:DUF4397 domain-containing protein [Rubrivivax albus]RVT52624.1 DUF4397 domain-containing protein [Rubrivivax albus]